MQTPEIARPERPWHTLTLEMPEARGQRLHFAWSFDPGDGGGEYPLRSEQAWFELPAGLQLDLLDEQALLVFALMLHWPLLNLVRPVRVRLPRRLPDAALETVQRLCDLQRVTLARPGARATLGASPLARRIEFVCSGAAARTAPAPATRPGLASGMSGGKEALAQLFLARAAGVPVLAVTTTSPQGAATEHTGPHRASTLSELSKVDGVTVVEVRSNVRESYRNDFPRRLGHACWLTDLLDCQVYLLSCAAVARCSGVDAFGLGMEWEVAAARCAGGLPEPHPHVMYGPATLAALSALLAPAGLRAESLLVPLPGSAVQRLLRRAFPDALRLQASCYSATDGARWCGRCPKCVRTAVFLALDGGDPSDVGLDWGTVWRAGSLGLHRYVTKYGLLGSPRTVDAADRYLVEVLDAIHELPVGATVRRLATARSLGAADRARALARYGTARLVYRPRPPRARAAARSFKPAALAFVHPRYHRALTHLLAEHGLQPDPTDIDAEISCIDDMIAYVTSPMVPTTHAPAWRAAFPG
ncbi:MAG: hypothetical protein KC543_11720 [Myxococcales bacterium]|nr:hypothetical protein [Myxococcales bacterium]